MLFDRFGGYATGDMRFHFIYIESGGYKKLKCKLAYDNEGTA